MNQIVEALSEIHVEFPEKIQRAFLPYRYKLLHGGRAGTKSWSVARILILLAYTTKHKIVCGREFQTSIKESSKALLEDQIVILGLGEYFSITREEIRCLVTGSIFIFIGLHHNPDSVKSLEGATIFWGEESSSFSQDSLDDLIPTIRTEGSELWFTMNRKFETDPVDVMFLGPNGKELELAGELLVIDINYMDNPWFPEVLRKLMEWDKKHDYDKYQHVWLGKCKKHSKALIFSGKYREDSRIKPDADTVLYYGADWGFSNDPSTLIRCWVDDEKREIYIDYEAYEIGVEIDDLPEFFAQVPDSKKWEIRADNARPETISFMRRHGYPNIVACKKGPGSVEDGITFLTSYTLVIHPRCINVLAECGLYSYKIDRKTQKVLPIILDEHNHCIDPIRYALEKLFFNQFEWDLH